MRSVVFRARILLVAGAATLGLQAGCSQPDNPTMAEAPVFRPPPNPEPPKIKGRREPYGSNTKYQQAMERMNTR